MSEMVTVMVLLILVLKMTSDFLALHYQGVNSDYLMVIQMPIAEASFLSNKF